MPCQYSNSLEIEIEPTYDIDTAVSCNSDDGIKGPEIYADDYKRLLVSRVQKAAGLGLLTCHSFS